MRKEPKLAGLFDFVVFRGARESTVTACSVFFTCFYIIVYTYCMKKKKKKKTVLFRTISLSGIFVTCVVLFKIKFRRLLFLTF
jgi:hypothetical protein